MLRDPGDFVVLLLLCSIAFAVPAEDKQAAGDLDCADPLNSAPIAVRGILDPLYNGRVAKDQLVNASNRLYDLSNAAGVCQIEMYLGATASTDSGDKNHQWNAVEWRSLNQWLSRLANIVGLRATGADHLDWKYKYAQFAEIYEFEI